MSGRTLSEADTAAEALLNRFSLPHLRYADMRALSGGEDQVLQVLLGVSRGANGLVVDDPFSMLDTSKKHEIRALLSEYLSQPFHNKASTDLILAVPDDADVQFFHDLPHHDLLFIHLPGVHLDPETATLLVRAAKCHPPARPYPELGASKLTLTTRNIRRMLFASFSYNFFPGHIYAITGANGSGKSLFLRTLLGHLPSSIELTSGKLTYSNTSHYGISGCISPHVIFVPQHCETLLTMYTPSIAALINKDAYQPDFSTYIHQLLQHGVLWDSRSLSEASAGETRFVTHLIAALSALARDNIGWLIVDEPDAYLDPTRRQFLGRLFKEVAARGKGIIIATHRPKEYPTAVEVSLDRNTIQ
jgi:ABC-type multidrug transport system ATPase subunit